MTRSSCRSHFYDQLDGLVLVSHATHIHLFPHTNCQYGWLKVRDKVGETFEQDLTFQVKILRNSCDGAETHLAKQFPDREIHILGRIILTKEKRVITHEEALRMLQDLTRHTSHEHTSELVISHDAHPHHTVRQTGHGPVITS